MAADVGPITLSLPSKYAKSSSKAATTSQPAPPIDWLTGTWTVTHSTLSMWRSARNVRITYAPLAARADGRARIDDLVAYEPASSTATLKTVTGVDTRSPDGSGWDWRGKGWLFFVSSHWEVLGWGESTTTGERWAVTWFAPTLFTKEGIDVYSSRREGISEAVYGEIDRALRGLEARPLVSMVEEEMRPVEIKLPWTEK
ncbi:hypothetical protein ISF_07409 [Cordyceps fumosorosea ARSEF 2679]|uniref:Histidinolphosphatase-like protein n=1 Tax=Cordyceps fumosorosea (strain ARSEF 2679) TaxID=1081104 RepID=A0A167PPM8_CORFA|nr:hypothetical protein ISF_07409 [Cordyceps fumosorosea ARSEF 2679]OAA56893.1 hypothetical protein ISF_07409 [Cordyceps fumosorosea ARSEF 2679]